MNIFRNGVHDIGGQDSHLPLCGKKKNKKKPIIKLKLPKKFWSRSLRDKKPNSRKSVKSDIE
jgi:hypothetical protein